MIVRRWWSCAFAALAVSVVAAAFPPPAEAQDKGAKQAPPVARPTMCSDGCEPAPTFSVQVIPHVGLKKVLANTTGLSIDFSVINTGLAGVYTFTCSATGGVTCRSVTPASKNMAAPSDWDVTVVYDIGSSVGTLTLTATHGLVHNAGSYVLTPAGVVVTPDGATAATRTANTGGYSESFTLRNSGPLQDTYTTSCFGLTNVTCTGTSPASVTLGAGAQTTVTASYSVAGPGSGTLNLYANDGGLSDGGSYTVPVVTYSVAVTPKGATGPQRPANTGGYSETFTIQNSGTGQDSYTFTCSGWGGVTCGGTSVASMTLAGGVSTTVTASYSVAASGTGSLTLAAHGAHASDDGSYVVPIALPTSPQAPSVVVGDDRENLLAYSEQLANPAWSGGLIATDNAAIAPNGWQTAARLVEDAAFGAHVRFQGFPYVSGTVLYVSLSMKAGERSKVRLNCANGNARFYADFDLTTGTVLGSGAGSGGAGTGTILGAEIVGQGNGWYQLRITGYVTGTAATLYIDPALQIVSGQEQYQGDGTSGLYAWGASVSRVSWTYVPTLGTALPAVTLAAVSARDLCYTIALGPAAASECGDLRIVHPLPTTRTMNKARTPTLLYNSQFAHPYPLVAGLVTLGTTAVPDSIEAVLRINGNTRRTVRWGGSQWAGGATRRIVVGYDAASDSTGIYSYTLEVASIYGGSRLANAPATGQLAVVNRQASPFGAGWWLAGLEELRVSTMMWVGGDGSVRQYQQVPGTTDKWVAPSVDHPDTLKRIVTNATYYVRYPGGGIEVWFDVLGRHVYTYNRQRHRTRFGYAQFGYTVALIFIELPTQYLGRTYFLDYTGSPLRLSSVTAPPTESNDRTTTITTAGGFITRIQDPDGNAVQFTPDGAVPELIHSRIDRRETPVTFSYDTLGGRKIGGSSLDMGSGMPPIVLAITPQQSLGLKQALDQANAFTLIDGPRTDSADITKVWQDRWDQPVLVEDAHGAQTRLLRGDWRWPGLATEVQHPNGWRGVATYDPRGNLASTTDYGAPSPATTSYQWDQTWDALTKVKRPEGDSVVMAYDAATGNRLWQEDARGSISRVEFAYYSGSDPGTGLLRSIRTASQAWSSPRDSLQYSLLGNLSMTITPLRFWALYYQDAIGRDTLVVSPIDSLQTLRHRSVTRYDLLGHDTLTISVGPATPNSQYTSTPIDSLFVRSSFDAAGNRLSLSRSARPDPNAIGSIQTTWVYDAAGRRVKEIAPDGLVDSTAYDPAGNPVTSVTRRGHQIHQEFDALNRLVQRVVPAVSYGTASLDFYGHLTFPRYPNSGSGLLIDSDVAVFSYDAVGNLVRADNGDARIRRTYALNGAIRTDSLFIRTYAGNDFGTHAYGLSYSYDLDGRRRQLEYPAQLLTVGAGVGNEYTYGNDGRMATISDVFHNTYRFAYDVEGRVDTLYSPGGIWEHPTYDPDGRVQRSKIIASFLVASDTGFPSADVRADTFSYDARGKVVRSGMINRQRDLQYTGLGMLSYDLTQNQRYGSWGTGQATKWDAFGNQWTGASASSGCPRVANETYTYQAGTGRRTQRREGGCMLSAQPDPMLGGDVDSTDASGNLAYQKRGWELIFPNLALPGSYYSVTDPFEGTRFYYGADQRLRVIDRQRTMSLVSGDALYGTFFEEYRYDALGRRILKRSRANSACTTSFYCKSAIERYVWDGDQLVFEIRYPGWAGGADLEQDTGPITYDGRFYGRVAYTNGGAIDRPLGVVRIGYGDNYNDGRGYTQFAPFAMTPHFSWEGLIDAASYETGAARRCVSPPNSSGHYYRCVQDQWPVRSIKLKKRADSQLQIAWFGSLLQDQKDQSGQLYMRNRYFDPETGRFTQEDPIGLAGGVNLYGFANGDLVNFSDPFGLCPPKTLAEVFICTGQILQPWQPVLEGMATAELSILPLGEGAGALTRLGLGGGRAASGIAAARALGEAGEAAAGIIKNTERIPSATGTAAFRVPDGLTTTTLTEVKNVAKLDLISQLRDFAAFARATGRAFDLVVRSTTEFTQPLLDFIRREGINVRFLP